MKKKVLFVLIFSIIISFFVVNTSFGANEDKFYSLVQKGYKVISDNGYDPKNFTSYFVLENGSTIIYLPDTSSFYVYDWGGLMCRASNFFVVDFDLNTLEPLDKVPWINMSDNASDIARFNRVTHSTFNMKQGDSVVFEKNIDFFRLAPVGITQVLLEATTQAKIMEQIKTMIVGFLKYLIALVISVIAFYKGWKFLSTQLKKS